MEFFGWFIGRLTFIIRKHAHVFQIQKTQTQGRRRAIQMELWNCMLWFYATEMNIYAT